MLVYQRVYLKSLSPMALNALSMFIPPKPLRFHGTSHGAREKNPAEKPRRRRAAVSLQMPPTASAGSRGTVTEFITKLRAAETPRMAPKEGEDVDKFIYMYVYMYINK